MSKPCRISYGAGFYACSTCKASDYPGDRPFACAEPDFSLPPSPSSNHKTDLKRTDRMAKKAATATVSTPMVKADPPPVMKRDDRRIIAAKLDDVYSTDAYVEPWTDAAVAKDLGVPRAWVSEVREAFFGPEGGNPLVVKIREGMEASEVRGAKLRSELSHHFEQGRMLRNALLDHQAKMDELRALHNQFLREVKR
ncbi:hypothetical protein [Martelella alba]|uniref:hypothetical protein n=1 Tax=Martelella alba TaxID=2590451 RepID=UPI0015E86C54|nr:hypothetical protein [Martelella alba]